MSVSTRRLFAGLVLMLALSLAACGGGQASQPTEAPEPTEAPTRTPRPTREPTEVPPPTEAPEPTEAPAAGSGELQLVDIGPLEPFEHPSGVFSIDIPSNWSLQDNSSADELILIWTDPTRNGAVIVDIFEDELEYSDEELINILQSFLESAYGSEPDFSLDDPIPQSDGSILLVWTYTATADNNVQAPLLGNSFIEQRGNKVSILSTLVPQEQFDTLVSSTDEIINTYRIEPGLSLSGDPVDPAPGGDPAPAGGELQPVDIGPLEPFEHPSGVFRIDVPNNWSLQDTSNPDELILIWTDPTRNGAVIVDIFEDEASYSDEELIEILRTFLEDSFSTQPDFSIDDPIPQSDGSILLVWTYTATADNNVQAPLLGNSFIEQRGNKVSILSTLVPQEQFDTLVPRTDEIINTYRINPDAPLVP